MPTMRDPSLLVYFRPESGGLIMGGYERQCAPWSLDGIPPDFNGKLLAEDWPRFEELMENAIVRVPGLEEMGVVRLINGPEAFTPDGEFILGPSDVRGFWVAAGFAPTGSRARAGWGSSSRNGSSKARRRSTCGTWTRAASAPPTVRREYTLARTKEIYETYYDVTYPGHERRPAGRCGCRRPMTGSLGRRRVRGEVGVGARQLVRAQCGGRGRDSPSSRLGGQALVAGNRRRAPRLPRGGRDLRRVVVREARCRGAGAAAFLESLCANRVARDVGAVTYTQMLNPRGGIECDFTVTRLGEERFRIVTGTAFGQHDLAWLRQHAPAIDGAR